MCIYLQWNQNVHHLHLSPFTYSSGACSLLFSCQACTWPARSLPISEVTLKSSKKTKKMQSKGGRSKRQASRRLLGRWNVTLKQQALPHAASLHEKQQQHTCTHDSSFPVHSSPDTAFFTLAQPCLQQTGVTVHGVKQSWNKEECMQHSMLFVLFLHKYFNSSDGFIWKVRTF